MSKDENYSIAAVVVTYNRKNLLRECLRALLSQTRPLNEIIVIDNASNDGTDSMVSEEFPQVTYIRLPENIGGAGGFHEGMKLAYEKGHDWIWVMDDDGIPNQDTLEKLLIYMDLDDLKIGVIAPIVYSSNGEAQIYHHKLLNRLLDERPAIKREALSAMHKPINIDATCFVGPLFRREVITQAGLPNKDFFIYADDLEYAYRIRKYYKILLVPEAKMIHKDCKQLINVRNRYRIPFQDYWRRYYEIRNIVYFKKKYLPTPYKILYFLGILPLKIFRSIAGIIIYDDKKLARLKIIIRAYYHGVFNILGKQNIRKN